MTTPARPADWSHLFELRGDPASAEAVDGLERRLDVTLPVEYRNFLRSGDGALFVYDNELDGTWGPEGPFIDGFRELFSVGEVERIFSTIEAAVAVYEGRVPAGFLPVGADVGDNLICLRVSGPHAGQVYFWDHEEEAEIVFSSTVPGRHEARLRDLASIEAHMVHLADSFNALLGRVVLEEPCPAAEARNADDKA